MKLPIVANETVFIHLPNIIIVNETYWYNALLNSNSLFVKLLRVSLHSNIAHISHTKTTPEAGIYLRNNSSLASIVSWGCPES